ncbi:D-Ala-D-Ala carboxypeptidase family metallohydrolase [Leeia sp.]|uniref:D-Ala-D-Ala carboxypeptidase family metallohydrolase n=1 Tax=Leeia sp. TaxID=2884678 RepID=UPI0035B3CA29
MKRLLLVAGVAVVWWWMQRQPSKPAPASDGFEQDRRLIPGKKVITFEQWLMGRDKQYPAEFSQVIASNGRALVVAVNKLLAIAGIGTRVTSGWRPAAVNARAGGAPNSNHRTGNAVDLADPTGKLGQWCRLHTSALAECGLWLENPDHTRGWVHLQRVAPKSGSRIFNP